MKFQNSITTVGIIAILIICLAVILLFLVRRKIKKLENEGELYGFNHKLKKALEGIFFIKPLVSLITSILINLYYGLFFFLVKNQYPKDSKIFSSYKENSYKVLFIIIICLASVELIGVHLLLTFKSSEKIAWITTILTFYSVLFVIADYVAFVKQPSILLRDKIYINVGLRWSGISEIDNILSVEKFEYKDYESEKKQIVAVAVMPTFVNLKITFKNPVKFTKMFGIKTSTNQIALSIDDKDQFMTILNQYINKN